MTKRLEDLQQIKNSILVEGISMIGHARMDNILECALSVLEDNIPGDFIETGVWKGGATIFMKKILQAYGDQNRKLFVCDSFEGLPSFQSPEDLKYQDLSADSLKAVNNAAISLEEVQENFKKYDAIDDNVKFIKGWFCDTLPALPTEHIALLRLDGDMYTSTMDALNNLYPKLSIGGYCVIDDYNYPLWPQCKQAVGEYRQKHNISEALTRIDDTGVYWRKEK